MIFLGMSNPNSLHLFCFSALEIFSVSRVTGPIYPQGFEPNSTGVAYDIHSRAVVICFFYLMRIAFSRTRETEHTFLY